MLRLHRFLSSLHLFIGSAVKDLASVVSILFKYDIFVIWTRV